MDKQQLYFGVGEGKEVFGRGCFFGFKLEEYFQVGGIVCVKSWVRGKEFEYIDKWFFENFVFLGVFLKF